MCPLDMYLLCSNFKIDVWEHISKCQISGVQDKIKFSITGYVCSLYVCLFVWLLNDVYSDTYQGVGYTAIGESKML